MSCPKSVQPFKRDEPENEWKWREMDHSESWNTGATVGRQLEESCLLLAWESDRRNGGS